MGTKEIRIKHISQQDSDLLLETHTAEERVGMMWQLALDTWAFMGEPIADTPLRRDIVTVHRGGHEKGD